MKKNTIILLICIVLIGLFLGEINEFTGKVSRKVIQKSAQPATENLIKINKNFNKDMEYSLIYVNKISHLSLNGNLKLKKDSSYVRVILKDQNNKEYLIFESHFLLNDNKYSFIKKCEETCDIEPVNVKSLIIEASDASIFIDSINFEKGAAETGAKAVGSKQRREEKLREKQNEKIASLNSRISGRGLSWTAGETPISRMSYADKKRLFTKPDGTPVDRLPNLYGFEYYKGGIFEIPSSSKSSVTGGIIKAITGNIINKITSMVVTTSLPSKWDWRNVNGENWLTPVKNQGNAGNCWAFAAIGAMEAQINLYYNQHLNVDLSEQQYADCINGQDLQMSMNLGLFPECTKNMCYPGFEYCVISKHGISDEACDPYAAREMNPSHCDQNHICNNWQDRAWKNFDFHDYKFGSDFGTPSCPKQTINLPEGDFKKILIEKGPMSSAILSWGHAMVLVGYEIDLNDGQTVWIFKNSWGTSFGENGYAKIKTTLESIGWASLPIGPFKPPSDDSYLPFPINCPSGQTYQDGACKPALACTDSDGGANYKAKGFTKLSDGSGLNDDCRKDYVSGVLQNTGELLEAVCKSDGTGDEYITYKCDYGCQDGACKLACTKTPGQETAEISCSDAIDNDCDRLIDRDDSDCVVISKCIENDNGLDIFTRGVTSAGLLREEDKCANSDLLVEQFCQEWDGVRYDAGVSTPLNNPYGVYGTTITPVGISSNSATFKVGSETATISVGQYKIFSSGIIVKLDSVAQPNSLGYQVANLYFRKTNERCPNGCLDGACLIPPAPSPCIDTDGGLNYYIEGRASGYSDDVIGWAEDYCTSGSLDGSNLVEFYCINSTNYGPKPYSCSNGCQDGACI